MENGSVLNGTGGGGEEGEAAGIDDVEDEIYAAYSSDEDKVEVSDVSDMMQRLTVRPKIDDLIIGVVVEFYTDEPVEFHSTLQEQMITCSHQSSARRENRPLGIKINFLSDKPAPIPIVGIVAVTLNIYDKGSGRFEYGLLAESYDLSDEEAPRKDVSGWMNDKNANNKRCRWDADDDDNDGKSEASDTRYASKKPRGDSSAVKTDARASTGLRVALLTWMNSLNKRMVRAEFDVNAETCGDNNSECCLTELFLGLKIHEEPLAEALEECVTSLYDLLGL